VANIEKSYDALKQKCQILEQDRTRLEDHNKKLTEEALKQRALRIKAEKELQT